MNMSNKEKKLLRRILITAFLFVPALILHYRAASESAASIFRSALFPYAELAVFLIIYAIIGSDILRKSVRNISRGQIFDENFLMSIAAIGAFCLAEYAEAVAVMLFYQVGEWFQSYAVSRSRRSIAELMDIRPDYANVLRGGSVLKVEPDDVRVDEIIVIKPGERIPLDGIILDGQSVIDTSALTGESVPRDAGAGDSVIGGCINQTGVLNVKVTKEYGQSTVAKILELVESASDKKSKSENFITRFARYYTPAVVLASAALAVIPPVIFGDSFAVWVSRALTFLVVSCPCALVISIPLSFFGGIGGASKIGVLVKGGNYLEMLSRIEIVVFDKTGTLTKGNFEVTGTNSPTLSREALLELAAHAEIYSAHPIALSIKKAHGKSVDASKISGIEELAGYGIKAVIDGKVVLAGNAKLMAQNGISHDATTVAETVVHVAADGAYAGCIVISDEIKPDSKSAIQNLKSSGVKQAVMLTGDSDAIGRKVAALLKLDKAYTQLLPSDKVSKMEELMCQKSESGVLAFVGDGTNDAPVLARADIGIAMGALGSDAAIEAADIVIMNDEPSKLVSVVRISKKTLMIVRQNIVLALGVKLSVLVLAAIGMASMWGAVFADVGVSVLAVLNAIRALNTKRL